MAGESAPALSIVIPAFNEEQRLPRTIEQIERYLNARTIDYELIIVDDGSTDGTRQVMDAAAARNRRIRLEALPANRGKGGALKAGVAIASRAVHGSQIEVPQPVYRVLMGKVFNLIVQAVLLPGIWDTQCGFKLFRADVAKAAFAGLTTDGFGYDPEVLYLAKRKGVKIAEVPVVWRHSAPTTVLPIRSSIDMFKHVVRVRFKR